MLGIFASQRHRKLALMLVIPVSQRPDAALPVLQGTPIQNNLEELWSLMDFAMQGTLLGTRRVFNKGEAYTARLFMLLPRPRYVLATARSALAVLYTFVDVSPLLLNTPARRDRRLHRGWTRPPCNAHGESARCSRCAAAHAAGGPLHLASREGNSVWWRR